MRHIVLAFLALFATSAPAAAVAVRDCNADSFTAMAQNIVEPWEKNSKTFYKGQVRVALLDTGGEPVCCSLHLLVLSPGVARDEPEFTACHLIGDHGNFGFGNIVFDKLTAAYDANKGLLITFPYGLYNDGGAPKPGMAKVRLNLATGAVTVEK